jgi:signal transduction histidine kinase
MTDESQGIYLFVVVAMIISLLMSLAIILFYMRYRIRLYKQLQRAQQAELRHQQELLRASILSEEKERKRIGKDLHDDVGTALSQMRMYIERQLPESGNAEFAQAFGRQIKSNIDRVIAHVRNISHLLSPDALDLYGFSAAIEELVDVTRENSGLEIELMNTGEEDAAAPDTSPALALYRVLEELLANTIKHAGAGKVSIVIHSSHDTLKFEYTDDGCGLGGSREKKPGIGLRNIESRLQTINAQFTMKKPPAGGFGMQIIVPLKNAAYEPA